MFEEANKNNQNADSLKWVEYSNSTGEISYKRYFFVDYENVNRDGLNGITKLTSDDCVRIYYSEAADTLTFGLHRRINESSANFEYIKIQMPIKNAVDCKIAFDIIDIANMSKKSEFYIISNDNDYDKAIDSFKVHKINVKRIPEICKRDEPLTNETKTQKPTNATEQLKDSQIRSFFGQHFKKQIYKDHKEDIIKIIKESSKKQEVNNKLMQFYDSKTAGTIYQKLIPLLDKLKITQ
jgi:hypothetical protein